MQLIKIVNVPIEYKLEIENARLEFKEGSPAAEPKMQMHHKNAQIKSDSSELNLSKRAREFASKRAFENTSNNAPTVANTAYNPQLDVDVAPHIAQLLQTNKNSNWKPAKEAMNYTPGAVTFDWNKIKGSMQYVPGEFNMTILEYPHLEIEYTGEPQYFPESADPNNT